MLFDDIVEQGLCKPGLIALVVPMTSIAFQIDKYIGVELLPVLKGKANSMYQCFGFVAIDMENGCFYYLGYIGAVGTAAGIAVIGCETNLVVYHYMDSATRLVTSELRHLNAFVNNSLRGNGGIAMNYDGSQFAVIVTIHLVNSRPRQPKNHGCNGFEV